MTIRVSPRFASFLALGLIALLGMVLIIKTTPDGLGLSDDSIAYIAGARSLVAGDGYREAWLASNQPVTHFPPAFPSVLAFFGFFGIDPLRAARWVNALLFGLNAGLLGILGWRMTRSLMAGLVLAALFAASGEMFQVHAVTMSEPLFIFLSLLAFWAFDLYFERAHHWWWLVACGIFVGLAYLTRYAGLALVAAFIVALLILHTDWKKRLVSAGIFLASVIPWALGWSIRNRLVAGNATNRAFAWHPLTSENIDPGLRVFSEFFVPIEPWRRAIVRQDGLIEGLIALVLGAVLVWVVVKGWKYISRPLTPGPSPRFVSAGAPLSASGKGGAEPREVISFTTGLYLFAYLASIISSMLMFDAATKFKLRILSPVLVSLLILLVLSGVWLWNRRREAAIVLAVLLLGVSIYKQSMTVNTWARSGLGYASFQWYDSKAMAFLRELPADIMIFTNEPAAVYLYTGRGCYVLPDRFDSATAQERADFEKGLAVMRTRINNGEAVLALFDDGDNVAGDVPALTEGLYLAHKSAGDSIYTAKP
ncbi:MAG: phospholipid carrier-dependent glycosyltransferase [Anaerolineales bacterium]|nr:phospholipid carrier-dependent glycosyltransferase [Anaerolineales bacterium]